MTGERDLAQLLAHMQPVLHEARYGYATSPAPLPGVDAFATIIEGEGVTTVAPLATLEAVGVASAAWARITLNVHSDLAAVGLTAAFAAALGQQGISANVIAGYFHDHIFVAWGDRDRAMAALVALSKSDQTST
jgi:hypothetical protein